MGAAMRALDWSSSCVGPPNRWPESLQTLVRVMLNTNHPMLIWWSPELVQFYNDAFREIAGSALRQTGLGVSGEKFWREIWHIIGPDIGHVMSGKGGVWRERQRIPPGSTDDTRQTFWSYSFSPIAEGDGVGGVLVVCRDETQEYRATLALRAREAELARVQQIGKIGGLEVNLTTGFRNRRSPEYLAIHGLPPEAAHETHEDWVRRIHPEDRERAESTFINAVNGNVPGYSTKYRIIRPCDGATRWILVTTEIERDKNGKAIRLVGAHADVTEQVLAEEALRRSEEKFKKLAGELSESLEKLRATQDRLVQAEKLASLGRLTAGIAHEIKNPLNFVNNFARLSNERIDDLLRAIAKSPPKPGIAEEIDHLTRTLQRNLDKVVQHGKRADSIVQNMLLHSRSGSSEHRPVDINGLVDETLNLAFHGARAQQRDFNARLLRSFDSNAGKVDLYPQEISRVFLNLISNGFYAATHRQTHSSSITSHVEPTLSVSTKSLENGVEIRIRDNGDGILPRFREKIFEPFFSTKPVGEGTGLGLSICHDIVVKQHRGAIHVETIPGEFCEFVVVLPRKNFE
ncbi:ATP-binding protein [Bradyrhizobium sp. WYCCWR 12699]|uniref:ATP-binding protein n=1 Tax=Bradyrhizobium sp. WYCCWR 12699 TaxID=3064203 RepID=UPI0028A3628A|nr:ATP-binding protein [Bradyrhizobium sp. WYCCWR 12699]MDT4739915.1 PAS domain-containing protein [Bradyrhizobium sp. WYCCWR 12699]